MMRDFWESISNILPSCDLRSKRSVEDIKNKWIDFTWKKEKAAETENEKSGTGGEDQKILCLSPLEETAKALMGKITVSGTLIAGADFIVQQVIFFFQYFTQFILCYR